MSTDKKVEAASYVLNDWCWYLYMEWFIFLEEPRTVLKFTRDLSSRWKQTAGEDSYLPAEARAVSRAFWTLAHQTIPCILTLEYSMQIALVLPPRLKSYIWHSTCRWQWLVYFIRSCATLPNSNKLFIPEECQQLMSAWTVRKHSMLSRGLDLLLPQIGTFIHVYILYKWGLFLHHSLL